MGAYVAIMVAKEREVVEAFRRAGATSAATARPLDTLGVDSEGVAMRRLRDRVVIREADAGRFYVDVEVWEALRRHRQRATIVILIVVLIAIVLGLITLR